MSEENRPTIRSHVSLTVAEEVEALRKAMKGFGTDEETIIKILTSCPSSHRQVIMQAYRKTFDRDLIKDLKKELSGDLETVILALMTPTVDYLAQELEQALERKDGAAVVQILFTCEPLELREIKGSFKRQDDDTLMEEVEEETTGVFRDVVLATLNSYRDDECSYMVTHSVARAIYNDDHGVDKKELVKAFSTLSYKQLKAVFVEYYKVAGRTLGEAFDLEFKGTEKANMQALFQCLQNRYGFLAASLRNSMAGLGTKDRDLIRLVISRSEVDLMNIKDEYFKMYNRTLENDIKKDTSGGYMKVLLALLQPNY